MTNKLTSQARRLCRPPDGAQAGAAKRVAPAGLSETDETELAQIARALGHPMRLRILRRLIAEGACQFGQIADLLPIAASTASQHMSILKEAGLVKGEIDGPRPCYCVDPKKLARLKTLLGAL